MDYYQETLYTVPFKKLGRILHFKNTIQRLSTINLRIQRILRILELDLEEASYITGYSKHTIRNWILDPRSIKTTTVIIYLSWKLSMPIELFIDGLGKYNTRTLKYNSIPREYREQFLDKRIFQERVISIAHYRGICFKVLIKKSGVDIRYFNELYKYKIPLINYVCSIANVLKVPPSFLLRDIEIMMDLEN